MKERGRGDGERLLGSGFNAYKILGSESVCCARGDGLEHEAG